MTAPNRLKPLTAEDFADLTAVSRETLDRLRVYAELLRRWQSKINLVGAATLPDLWRRHMLDSAQLHPLLPIPAGHLIDLGSGAGFPGLVLAIMGVEDVELIESDARKCAFLREAAGATATPVAITKSRIEDAICRPAQVVTARALAPLVTLLGQVARFLAEDGVALLLKGAGVEQELTAAAKVWTMRLQRHPSRTDPSGEVLEIKGLSRG